MIRGVEAVEVRVANDGSIDSVEVRIAESRSTTRVIRDIESALMSGLGLRIDHKAIRVMNGRSNGQNGAYAAVQEDLGEGNEGGDEPPEYPTADTDRIRLLGVHCKPDGRGYCEVTVEIAHEDGRTTATIREADTRRGRMQSSARAAIDAVTRSAAGAGMALGLEGLEEFEVGDEDGLLAVLTVLQGRERRRFHGAALEHADPESSAARAVLDGLNRYWAAPEGVAVNT
ncbi:MAG TPA: hypothetical protein VEY33_00100 [Gemmatimonadota bacterium]|nr:hypothetical protein [Gemmatimonadota bacterium]